IAEPFWKFPDFDPYSLNQAVKQRIIDLQRMVSGVVNDVVAFVPVISDGRMTGGLGLQKPVTQDQLQPKMYLLHALGLMIGNGFSNSMTRGALERRIDQAHLETAKVQQQQDSLKQAFSRYVSSSVVDEISRNAGSINVGGKRQAITILFADLRGFTALASKMPNEGLAVLLNDWLERASQRLFQLDGTIDKFLGDGIMALFGAPLPQADHALRAAYTAFNLQEAFENYLSENRKILEDNTIGMGIGIATGTVLVGNFGSRRRMEFTAVGDAVNLAARLEKVAEDGDIIIDKTTLNLLQDRFAFTTKSKVPLKGKEPMDVYRLTGVKVPWGS
ncbi:MAG TPA: adenylate/guanylate cyclase domain-containing protein, partial [Candidatus Ozemobacteraceae bacterium]|nr:adenylate/guanylate cyclase domain-containing protein [Candidatus Ozemobacteraceae bacterium]